MTHPTEAQARILAIRNRLERMDAALKAAESTPRESPYKAIGLCLSAVQNLLSD